MAQDNKTIISIIFSPERQHMLAELFASLAAQNFQQFDIQITRQPGTDNAGLKRVFRENAPEIAATRLSDQEAPYNPGNQRRANHTARLDWASKKSDRIILLDDDDRVPADYVGKSIARLDELEADVITADLWAFNEHTTGFTPALSPRLTAGQEIGSSDLMHKNAVGFGHSTLRSKGIMPYISELTDDNFIIDWGFFARMAHDGKRLRFAGPDHHIEYRQHGANIVGLQSATPEALKHAIKSKEAHYRSLSQSAFVDKKTRRDYRKLAAQFGQMADKAKEPAWLENYARSMTRKAEADGILERPLWWELARPAKTTGPRPASLARS